MADESVPTALGDTVQAVTGRRVTACVPLTRSSGYSPALRIRAHFADGTTAFVKAATNDFTANSIRREEVVYRSLGEQLFLPAYIGVGEYEQGRSLLILEDLSDSYWGPPWREGDVAKVLAMLEQVRPLASRFPADFLPSQDAERHGLASWARVAADPEPFLTLGYCSRDWLEAALPVLLNADETAVLAGDDLVHQDVRSDNLCFTADGRAILVDWNWACYGNGTVDIAGWLPSLRSEGGPAPESVLPDDPALAGILAGFWAANAGLPAHDFDPAGRIRRLQRTQVAVALPWAARELGLPPPCP